MTGALEVGERAPDFVLPTTDGAAARFYGRTGGQPTAIVLPATAASTLGQDFADALGRIPGVVSCWIASGQAPLPAGVSGWLDDAGAVRARFGAADDADRVVLLDSNLRVLGAVEGAVTMPRLLELIDAFRTDTSPAQVVGQAPLLIVPRVIDADGCAALITRCRAAAVETGVEKSGTGSSEGAVDHVLKRRRDLTVTEPAALSTLSAAIGRRLMPEVQRAFAFRATRFEGFKVAWYDDESGGFFSAHRDNLTPATAHRVFGLSINLNDDYEGGDLEFPEYGTQRYRAPVGAAMVFSCALLHAVRPVVKGSRFVLLSFLYADATR